VSGRSTVFWNRRGVGVGLGRVGVNDKVGQDTWGAGRAALSVRARGAKPFRKREEGETGKWVPALVGLALCHFQFRDSTSCLWAWVAKNRSVGGVGSPQDLRCSNGIKAYYNH